MFLFGLGSGKGGVFHLLHSLLVAILYDHFGHETSYLVYSSRSSFALFHLSTRHSLHIRLYS